MKSFRQVITVLSTAAMISLSSTSLEACFVYDIDGCGYFDDDCCGYADCRECYSLAPAIAIGTLAIAAIIAIAVKDPHGAHSHSH